MTNVKFGGFCLGLAVAVGAAVSTVGAQVRPSTRERQALPDGQLRGNSAQVDRLPRGDLFVLDGRGAQLGVMVSDVDPKATAGGVKIDEVNDNSPAEKAGLKAGDIVVDYDGEKVRSARQLTRLVQETPDGRSVAIGILRDGKKQTLNATPEAGRMTWDFGDDVERALREAERGMRGFRFDGPGGRQFEFRNDGREPRRFEYRMPDRVMPLPGFGSSRGRLGVSVQSLTDDLQEYFGVKNGGALVSSVTPDSAASKAGIKAGDVIVSVHGRSVRDSDALIDELGDLTGEVTIVVMRDKKEMTLKATLADRSSGSRVVRPSRPGLIL